jgi:hypothetical protein
MYVASSEGGNPRDLSSPADREAIRKTRRTTGRYKKLLLLIVADIINRERGASPSVLDTMFHAASAGAVFSSDPFKEKKRLDPPQQIPVKTIHLQKLFKGLKVAIILAVFDDFFSKLWRD